MGERPVLQDPLAPWTVPTPEPVALGRGEPRTVGPFRIRNRLGSGGMGDVYLGTGRRGQQVAIKLIRGTQLNDAEFRARFGREVRAAGRVRSPYVANLVDSDLDADVPWLATEYVSGPTLSQALAAHGPLPQDAVLNLVGGVAEALHAIHGAGLVHRDVKPSNVILGPDGPCLIDLGVVASIDALEATRVTMTGQPVGTPIYMAPEQAMADRTSPATDVWALGALAYFAATGNRLFAGTHPAAVLYQVAAEEPSYDDCPEYLRPLLDACLVRDPAQRASLETTLRSLGRGDAIRPAGVTWPVRAETPAPEPASDAAAAPAAAPAGAATPAATTASAPGAKPTPAGESFPFPDVTGAPSRPRPRRTRRALLSVGAAVAGVAVLAATGLGIWSALGDGGDTDDGGTDRVTEGVTEGADQAGPTDPAQGQNQDQDPAQVTGPSPVGSPGTVTDAPVPEADGSREQPWAQGSAQRLSDGSCWIVSIDDVQGRVATLTLTCDQAGTAAYGTPTPSQWLRVSATGADGTVARSTPQGAAASDTFWAQGNLLDPSSVTTTVTLPDVGQLVTVGVHNREGDGWEWAATR